MRKSPIAYLVRHGETAGNAAGLFRGDKDFPLNADGKLDAKNLGKFFRDIPLSAVYSSPRMRAQDTAHEIAAPHGLKVETLQNASSLNVGYLAGEPKSAHKHVLDYFEKFTNERIPLGESIDEFRGRTQPLIKSVLAAGMKNVDPVVLVTHSSLVHELSHMLTGDHKQVLVKPGGVAGVWHDPVEGFKIKALLYPSTGEGDSKYHG